MKKVSYLLVIAAVVVFAACNQKKDPKLIAEGPYEKLMKSATDTKVAYVLVDRPQVNLDEFAKDSTGYITLFDGKSMKGWRGYNADTIPARWTIDSCALKVSGSGTGEAHSPSGGDLIFAHKFKNFRLTFDWKVDKGSNSGVFILAQEIKGQPIYISSPEYQILDNENHPDAKAGVNGNRQSASLYDMIPANPQNSKPFGQWNTGAIEVYKGSVFYEQNGVKVAEYHLWTPQWTDMLQKSKFSQKAWPLAFELLNNCGGDNHEGYIGFQDHGDDVWFKNIKVKVTD